MATLIQPQLRHPFEPELIFNGDDRESDPSRQSNRTRRNGHEVEPLEHAVVATEAPESASDDLCEAPDAGKGGVQVDDHEFVHGRSRS
jgi:hypothetical protein